MTRSQPTIKTKNKRLIVKLIKKVCFKFTFKNTNIAGLFDVHWEFVPQFRTCHRKGSVSC